jgi:hypothetical protein
MNIVISIVILAFLACNHAYNDGGTANESAEMKNDGLWNDSRSKKNDQSASRSRGISFAHYQASKKIIRDQINLSSDADLPELDLEEDKGIQMENFVEREVNKTLYRDLSNDLSTHALPGIAVMSLDPKYTSREGVRVRFQAMRDRIKAIVMSVYQALHKVYMIAAEIYDLAYSSGKAIVKLARKVLGPVFIILGLALRRLGKVLSGRGRFIFHRVK